MDHAEGHNNMNRYLITPFIIFSILSFFTPTTQTYAQGLNEDPLIAEMRSEAQQRYDYYDKIKIAAEQGDAQAQANLAYCYFTAYCGSRVIDKNPLEAFRWAEISSKQENLFGLYELGIFYRYGFGVTKNYKKSLELYNLTARRGLHASIFTLRDEYRLGQITSIDNFKSYIWASVAVQLTDVKISSKYKYSFEASAIHKRDEIEKLLNRSEIEKAQLEIDKCISSNLINCLD